MVGIFAVAAVRWLVNKEKNLQPVSTTGSKRKGKKKIKTYKMTSISSRVRPLVSGRRKKAQVEATNIQAAKKNQVP